MNELQKTFYLRQKQLIRFANSDIGRKHLELGNFADRVVEVGPNHVFTHIGRKLYRGKFWVGYDMVAKKLGLALTAQDIVKDYTLGSFLHYLGIEENPFLPQILFATYNTTTGDGRVGNDSTNAWATRRALTTGTYANVSPATQFCAAIPGTGGQIDRGFEPSDTSAIADGSTVTVASFNFYLNSIGLDPGAGKYLYMVTTAQASTSTFTTSEFDEATYFGGATPTDQGHAEVTSMSTSAYNAITLNATGRGNISKTGATKLGLRMDGDFNNTEPAVGEQINFNSSGSGSNLPYYDITVSAAAGSFLMFF